MIPPHRLVEIEAIEFRRLGEDQIALLRHFADQRLMRRLVGLDAAPRQMPARNIGVPDEKDSALGIEGHPAHPQRHRPLQAEIDMEQPRQQPPAPGLELNTVTHQFRIIQI